MMAHFKLALPAAMSGSLLFIVGCSDPGMQQEMEQAAPGSQAGALGDQPLFIRQLEVHTLNLHSR